jgi:hypothetical protein
MNRHTKREVDRFTSLPNYLLEHEAVRSLSPAAFKVMIYLAKRCFGPKNNGQIAFGSRFGCKVRNIGINRDEEKTIGLSRGTTARALAELQERGLIRCTKGSTFKLSKRSVREYELAWLAAGEESKANTFLYWRAAEKHKGRLTSETVRSLTVSPVGQPQRTNDDKRPLQSHQRDYARSNSLTHGTRINQCNSGAPISLQLDDPILEALQQVWAGSAISPAAESGLAPEKQFGSLANGFRAPETVQ